MHSIEARQYRWTSLSASDAHPSGFQCAGRSTGLSQADEQLLRSLSTYRFPRQLPPDDLAAAPVARGWLPLPDGRLVLSCSWPSGRDFAGRPGNYVSHHLVVSGANLDHDAPALFDLLRNDHTFSRGNECFGELPTLHWDLRRSPSDSRATLLESPRSSSPALLAAAVEALFSGSSRRGLIITATAEEVFSTVAMASELVPAAVRGDLSFLTYCESLQTTPHRLVGVLDASRLDASGFAWAERFRAVDRKGQEIRPDQRRGPLPATRYARYVAQHLASKSEDLTEVTAAVKLATVALGEQGVEGVSRLGDVLHAWEDPGSESRLIPLLCALPSQLRAAVGLAPVWCDAAARISTPTEAVLLRSHRPEALDSIDSELLEAAINLLTPEDVTWSVLLELAKAFGATSLVQHAGEVLDELLHVAPAPGQASDVLAVLAADLHLSDAAYRCAVQSEDVGAAAAWFCNCIELLIHAGRDGAAVERLADLCRKPPTWASQAVAQGLRVPQRLGREDVANALQSSVLDTAISSAPVESLQGLVAACIEASRNATERNSVAHAIAARVATIEDPARLDGVVKASREFLLDSNAFPRAFERAGNVAGMAWWLQQRRARSRPGADLHNDVKALLPFGEPATVHLRGIVAEAQTGELDFSALCGGLSAMSGASGTVQTLRDELAAIAAERAFEGDVASLREGLGALRQAAPDSPAIAEATSILAGLEAVADVPHSKWTKSVREDVEAVVRHFFADGWPGLGLQRIVVGIVQGAPTENLEWLGRLVLQSKDVRAAASALAHSVSRRPRVERVRAVTSAFVACAEATDQSDRVLVEDAIRVFVAHSNRKVQRALRDAFSARQHPGSTRLAPFLRDEHPAGRIARLFGRLRRQKRDQTRDNDELP